MKMFLRIVKIYSSHSFKRHASVTPTGEHLGELVRVLAANPDGEVSLEPRSMRYLFGQGAIGLAMRYTVVTGGGKVLEVFSDEVNQVSNDWLATQHEQRTLVAA